MKLYWRYKKNGKWTWTAAHVVDGDANTTLVYNREEEEE